MVLQKAFYTVSDITADNNSQGVVILSNTYSIQVNVTGLTFSAIVKLQTSIDGVNWVDLSGAESTAITNDSSILFDINSGLHRFTRVFVTVSSGTLSVEAFLSGGGWKNV